MTDLTPAQLMDNTRPLVSRQAGGAVTPAVQPPAHLGAFKPENLQIAEQLAKASDMLPRHYVNKPGACLLLLDWCERNDVPLLEAAGEISFVHGKPSVGARLQKKLAARFGYRTQKIEGDETSCTVAVFDPSGVEVGRFTYTIELANAIGHGKTNDMYRKDPAQMLWHRATARALDHYGPGELSPVMADEAIEPDPVEVAVRPQEISGADVDAVAAITNTPVEKTEAGLPVKPAMSEAELRALIKATPGKTLPQAMRLVQGKFPDDDLSMAEAIVAHEGAMAAVREWLDQ